MYCVTDYYEYSRSEYINVQVRMPVVLVPATSPPGSSWWCASQYKQDKQDLPSVERERENTYTGKRNN